MRFRSNQIRQFSSVYQFLRNLNTYTIGPRITAELIHHSGMLADEIDNALRPGNGPNFLITDLNQAQGEYRQDSNTICLATYIAQEYENPVTLFDLDAEVLLESTILHELVHYGRHVRGLPERINGYEAGKLFELAAYFGDVRWRRGSRERYITRDSNPYIEGR